MMRILSLATEDFPYQVSAAETKELLAVLLPPVEAQRFQVLVDASRIQARQAFASIAELRRMETLDARNAAYTAQAPVLAERVGLQALHNAGVNPRDIDAFIVASSTGHMVPTLDQHLVSRLGLRSDVRCLCMAGLGCAGAVRAIGFAADLLSRNGAAALVVSVELCSLWLQMSEPSVEDMLSTIVFGDGAAATVIGRSGSVPAFEVVAAYTGLWPDSLEARGARLTGTGFRHFSSPKLARVLRANLQRTVSEFLVKQGVGANDLRFSVVNPSDHRLLETIGSILDLPEHALRPAWQTWEQRGNTLSAGPLYVLRALQASEPPADGDLGLVIVLGPGITCDLLLLRWRDGVHGRV